MTSSPTVAARLPARPLHLLDSARGLPSNQVHRIARDRQSRLWLATPAGLARYDGHFIQAWDRRNGLACGGLRCVTIDSENNVWIGTDLGFERLDTDGKILPGVLAGTWHLGLCQHIDVGQGTPWVATAGGLARLAPRADGGVELAYLAQVGFVSDVLCLSEDRTLAVLAQGGLIETDGNRWWPYTCEGIIGRTVNQLKIGYGGQLLVGTDDGLYIVDDTTRVVRAALRLPHMDAAVSAIAADADRNWVAFGRTMLAFTVEGGRSSIVERFTADSAVTDLLPDTAGNVFVATNSSGLCQVSCLRHAVQKIDLGVDAGVYAIKPLGGDVYALGGEQFFGTATIAEGDTHARLSCPRSVPPTIVWDSIDDASGCWLATQAGVFHALVGNEFSRVFATDPVLGAPARVLMRHADLLWIGTLHGLARVANGVASAVDGDGLALGYVYLMCEDASSTLWVGTLGRGLWRWQDRMVAVATPPLSATGNTYAVAPGPDGRMVVLQDEKIILLEPNRRPRLVAELPPVAGWTLAWIDARTIAIGASDGLRVVDIASGRMTCLVQSLHPQREWEFTNNRTLVQDQQGRFLCGVNGGLLRVDLAPLRSFTPPACRLVDVLWSHAETEQAGTWTRVQPGRWSFRLRAYCAWFGDSTPPKYQFQLVGFDDVWSPPQETPEITFTSLPPGHYRLLCRSNTALAGVGPAAELLKVMVVRPFWLAGWTSALAGIGQLYDRLVGSRARNDFLLAQNRALELAVEERTHSLLAANQALEAVRDAYKHLSDVDQLTALGNRRFFEREIARAISLTKRLGVPLALLMIDIDHFKAVNDLYGHPVGDEYLRAIGRVLAAAVRTGEDVAARFGGEEFAVLLINTSDIDAITSAERIRADVEALKLENKGAPGKAVSISIGIAAIDAHTAASRDDLVVRADQALYRAKSSGRNRVVVWAAESLLDATPK